MINGYVMINDIQEIVAKTQLNPEIPTDNTLIPVFYPTYKDGWKDIADDMVTILQQFIDDERELEHTDFATDNDIAWAELDDQGIIRVYYADEDGIDKNTPLFQTDIKTLSS